VIPPATELIEQVVGGNFFYVANDFETFETERRDNSVEKLINSTGIL
jgi:hypothetical protein